MVLSTAVKTDVASRGLTHAPLAKTLNEPFGNIYFNFFYSNAKETPEEEVGANCESQPFMQALYPAETCLYFSGTALMFHVGEGEG
jgi:hypothetical protein